MKYLFLVSLLALAACMTSGGGAHGKRTDYGHVAVTAISPAINTQVIAKFNFRIEESRISESQPGNATEFAFSWEPDGCLHGEHSEEFCLGKPIEGDDAGSARWRSTRGQRTFTTSLSADGHSLTVDVERARGIFALAEGPALDQIRSSPWMLGVAFIAQAVPAADPVGEGAVLEYRFTVDKSE